MNVFFIAYGEDFYEPLLLLKIIQLLLKNKNEKNDDYYLIFIHWKILQRLTVLHQHNMTVMNVEQVLMTFTNILILMTKHFI